MSTPIFRFSSSRTSSSDPFYSVLVHQHSAADRKAVPLADIPRHDILDGPKQPRERLFAQRGDAKGFGAGSADSSGTGLPIEQGQL